MKNHNSKAFSTSIILGMALMTIVSASAGGTAPAEGSGGCSACSGRIVGGVEAPRNAYPWMAALVRTGSDAYSGQFCGGSLINSRFVLSAGHCVGTRTASDIQVVLGVHQLSQTAGTRRINVSRIIRQPNYTSAERGYDLALLELAEPATGFATIPLVSSASQVPDGAVVRAIGWGATREGGGYPDELRQVDVGLININTAVNLYAQDGTTVVNSHTMLAAGRLSGGVDTCQGDSGGPLVRSVNGQWILVGATSWGTGCARPNLPGFYANVLAMRDWVTSNIGGSGGGGTTPADDHGNDTSHATAVAATGSTAGAINSSGDADYFRFALSAASVVTIRTTGSTDTMGALFNQTGQQLEGNDDADGSMNFRIIRTLAAGTYFIRVTGYQSTTGAYTLVRTAQPVAQPEIAVRSGSASVESGSAVNFNRLVTGRIQDVTLTVLNTGNAALALPAVTVSGSSAFRITSRPAASVAAGRSTSIVVRFAPTSAGSHAATLSLTTNDADENPFVIQLAGSAEAPVVDDFPNVIGSASRIVSIGSTTNGALEREGDADTFRFYLSRTTSVRVQTTGGTDTYGHLYSSAGVQLSEDDDSGTGLNFSIGRRLAPGWYYIKVRGFADAQTGSYSLRLTAE